MCGEGLFLEPIREADPAGHVLSKHTKLHLLEQLQTHVRLVDSGDVNICVSAGLGPSRG